MQEYQCEQCKSLFSSYPSQRRNLHIFCSRACKYQWNRTLPGYWKGKKMSEEARQKMRDNHADFRMEKNGRWRGGRRIDKDGYVLVLLPDHPYRDYHGYVREHRVVMEKSLGRHLSPDEVVHHLDGDKTNNDLSNLKLYENGGLHQSEHFREGTSGLNKILEQKRSKKGSMV